jgi:hypothetical protein
MDSLKVVFRNSSYVAAPGSMSDIVAHPSGRNAATEVAVFQSHRYAFFYWARWTRKVLPGILPCLVSIDWHQDLCYPTQNQKQWLAELNIKDDREIAAFSWASLSSNNDDHILAAAYLNLIGNVYVLCRQRNNWSDEGLIDKFGNAHSIRKFETAEDLQQALLASTEAAAYLDVDLDYFAIKEGYNRKMKASDYMSKADIKALFDAEQPWVDWIYQRLEGFTIATEPEYCGGLAKSNELLDTLNSILFNPGLFEKNCIWKHLRKR